MDTSIITLQPNNANSWLEAAQRWLEAAERRRGSVRTRTEYQRNLSLFFKFVAKEPDRVTGADCQRWASTMQETGLSKATINTRLAAVSSFYQFVSTRYEVEPGRYLHNFNPASVVTREHINPYEKSQGLAPDQVRALLKACDRSTVKGLRDYALLIFYIYTGRRRAEIARLTWADLRPGSEPGVMEYHYRGKGDKISWRELPAPVWTALESYLNQSARLATMTDEAPLFVAHKSTAKHLARVESGQEGISEHTINQIVKYAARRAGLNHVKVHQLRHTSARLRRKSGASLEEVSQFLDHQQINTTMIYLGSLEAKRDLGWQSVKALLEL